MHNGTASFDGGDNLEAGIAADFTHSTDSTSRLLEPDIPRPGGGAGAEKNTLLALHQWLWETGCVAHHTIDDTIEQQFHLPWDVTPIAGRTGIDCMYLVTSLFCHFSHNVKHLRD